MKPAGGFVQPAGFLVLSATRRGALPLVVGLQCGGGEGDSDVGQD